MSANALQAQLFKPGEAGRALAGITGAVQAALHAKHNTPATARSTQPPPVSFGSVDLEEWKRWIALSLFKGKDGTVRFTEGRAMVRRRPAGEAAVEINVLTVVGGGYETWEATALRAASDGVLPGVLTLGQRRGAWAATLRVRGESATLAPQAGRPLAEAVELRVGGGQPLVVPLETALEKLGLQWRAVDDDDEDDATQAASAEAAEANAEAAAPLREEWALTAADELAPKAWERVAVLCAMGVATTPDGGGTTVADAAAFIAGAAGSPADAESVAWALLAAQARAVQPEAERGALNLRAAAGDDCVTALRALLDAAGAGGTAELAREARAFRADVGAPASAATRGGFAARALRERAAAEAAARHAASPTPRGARQSPRRASPRGGTTSTALTLVDETPRSREIRRLLAEKAAEAAGGATATQARFAGARLLDFGSEPARPGGAGERRKADGAAPAQPPAQRPRAAAASDFAELRPEGAEGLPAAEVVRKLEEALAGTQRVTTALAVAAGRAPELVGLVSADSGPALRAAAVNWRTLHVRVLAAAGGVADVTPPADWSEAADRLLVVLMSAGEGAGAAGPAQPRGGGGAGDAHAAQGGTVKSLRDLPAGSTTKLAALKTDTGAAARRAADAAVLQPLCTLETLQLEAPRATTAAAETAVAAVSRLVHTPEYGGAAWAAVFSNMKYTGCLPAEGTVPASVAIARQSLYSLIHSRVEDVVGEARVVTVIHSDTSRFDYLGTLVY